MYRGSTSISCSAAAAGDIVVTAPAVPDSRTEVRADVVDGVRLFHLSTLGRFRLFYGVNEVAAPRTANARALLAYCLARPGQDIARERLLELFWSDSDVARARGSFKTALWLIRVSLRTVSCPADRFFYTNKSIVRWQAPATLDRDVFVTAANRSDLPSLRVAYELYTGEFLEGDYGQWAVEERARIADIYENLLIKMLAIAPDSAVAERLLERNPYSEIAYRVLIAERLAAGGLRAAARYSERCLTALAEIGAQPSSGFPVLLTPPLRNRRDGSFNGKATHRS